MSDNHRERYGIARYFTKEEEGARGGPPKDPSRMFQLNRLEGTGQGKAGPTHTYEMEKSNSNDGNNEDNGGKHRKGEERADAYAYGGTEGDRKGKRDAHLGPQKIKRPQKAVPLDD